MTALTSGKRQANFELLRMICMMMIITGHALLHGEGLYVAQLFSANYFLGWTVYAFIQVEVNCFVMVSGYFLCTSKFRLKKVIEVYATAWFWSVLLTLVMKFLRPELVSTTGLVKAFLPFTQQEYWYVTTYLLMMLAVPFLNLLIQAMNQKQHLALLVTYFLIYILLQNVVVWRTFTTVGVDSPVFFGFLYMTAAYIRLYGIPVIGKAGGGSAQSGKKCFLLYVAASCVTALSRFVIAYVTVQIFGTPMYEGILCRFDRVTVVLATVFLFGAFCSLKISNEKLNRVICKISGLTFGIYLIHENTPVRDFLWTEVFHSADWGTSLWMVPLCVLVMLGVFAACGALEFVRQELWKRLGLNAAIQRLSERLERCLDRRIERG